VMHGDPKGCLGSRKVPGASHFSALHQPGRLLSASWSHAGEAHSPSALPATSTGPGAARVTSRWRLEPVRKRHCRPPFEILHGYPDVGAAAARVIGRLEMYSIPLPEPVSSRFPWLADTSANVHLFHAL
jgi:hypothetical protein